MARRPPSRPLVRLGVLAGVIVALYASMIGTGHLTPPLGLDLRGGTTLTLTPQKTAGKAPSKQVLNTAVDIIRQRVNGLGVSGADVVTQGNNVVISVPGKGRSQVLDQVGQTASLSFREIYTDASGNQYVAANPTPTTSTSPSTTTSPTTSSSPGASTSRTPSVTPTTAPNPTVSSSPANRPLASALLAATPTPTPSPTGAAISPGPTTSAPVGVVQSASSAPSGPAGPAEKDQTAPSAQVLAAFSTLDCSKNGGRPPVADDDPHHFVLACDRTGQSKYLLKPADILGTAVSSANATIGSTSTGASTGLWEVDVTFKDSAVGTVNKVSSRLYSNSMQQLAITLDGVVVSAPSTNSPNLGKNIQISGSTANPFTQKDASNLANALKYGSLPVAFTRSTAETVSATLGKSSLHAGLLAGAIGLGLVLVYVFLYYRMLGFVTVASLTVSGLLVFSTVTLLGSAIGYTLSLPGIAGLIVSIGITADSFVVFFERLKDEMREGRSPRLAVEYGWVRARRTIFSADTVSFLAAVILYLVSVGDVKGFAFTLGLSTALDIVVVLMFTKPLMSLLIRYPAFSTSRASGISPGRIGRTAVAREA